MLNLEEVLILDQLAALTGGVGPQGTNMWLGAQRKIAGEISY